MDIIRFEDADFPIESFLIDFREKAKRRSKNANDTDKLKIMKQLCLIDVFLYRIKMDPGFFAFVCDELINDETPLKLTYLFLHNKYHKANNSGDDKIYKISVTGELDPDYLGDTSTTDLIDISRPRVPSELSDKLNRVYNTKDPAKYEEYFSNLQKEIEKYEKDIPSPFDRIFYSLNVTNFLAKSIGIGKDLKAKNKYLNEQLEIARSDSNEDRAYAIKSLIDEYSTNKIQINGLFGDKDIFLDISGDYNEYWDFISKKYLIEHIKFLDVYQGKVPRHLYYNPINEGIGVPAKAIILSIIHELKELTNHPVRIVDEFDTNDTLMVAGLIWFTNKTEKDKISILEKITPFNYATFKQNTISITDFMNPDKSVKYADTLTKLGYYNSAEYVYDTIIKTCKGKDDFNAFMKIKKAAIYYHENDYKARTKLLNDVLRTTSKNYGNPFFDEMRVSIFADLAIMCYKIKPDDSKHYEEEALKLAHSLPLDKRYDSLFYIASFYDKIGDYDRAYKLYSEIKDNINFVHKYKDYTVSRLNILAENKNIDGSLNKEKLKQLEIDNLYQLYLDNGSALFYSLQFDAAENWFNQGALLKNDSNVQGWFGIIQYSRSDYQTAKKTFETILTLNPEDISAYLYLSIISVIEGKNDQAISYLSRSIDISFKTGVDYHLYKYLLPDYFQKHKDNAYTSNLRMFIKEMIFHKKFSIISDLIEGSKNAATQHINIALYYNDIGTILTDFGFFQEGREYYTKAIQNNPSVKELSSILANIGTNYANQYKHLEAIPFYDQALNHDPENYRTWNNKAMSLLHKGDFKSAYNCIDKSIQLYSKNLQVPNLDEDDLITIKNELIRLDLKKEMVRAFKDNVIKIGFIDRSDDSGKRISSILLTAEKLLFRMGDKSLESFDYSMALVEYGKALESTLHSRITVKAYEYCKEQLDGKFEFYLTTDQFEELPRSLNPSMKNINMTIFLGDWQYLKSNLKANTNPISQKFLEYVNSHIDANDWSILVKSAKEVSKYRNGSAHKDLKNRDEVLKVRGKIVNYINDVIDILYKKS